MITCPLLLDGSHLLLSKAPVLCKFFPLIPLEEAVRQFPHDASDLLSLTTVVRLKRQWKFIMKGLISSWIGLTKVIK